MQSYKKIWQETSKTPWCVLLTTGRVGSDFFQSLLDSHPEIYVFNGVLKINDFWAKAYTTKIENKYIVEDIINEFVGHYIVKFKSYYDLEERKNELGKNRDEFIDINIEQYKIHLKKILELEPITTKSFLRAVYLAWALVLGQDLSRKKLFFHHLHHIWDLDTYLKDFPNSKIIAMTRDPRAAYVSGVENWNKYSKLSKNPSHNYFVLNRTIEDASYLETLDKDYRVLKLEDLGQKKILENFCSWAGVSFNKSMLHATWNGLRWWGDKLSTSKIKEKETGFSPSIIKNKWEEKLGIIEKVSLNFLLYNRLKWYGYKCENKSNFLYFLPMLFFIIVPTKYEWQYISPKNLYFLLKEKKIRLIFTSFYYYSKRVLLFYKLLLLKIKNKKFELVYFKN